MLLETAVRINCFQTTATHEPQKLMSGHIMEEHIINITSSKIEREREREKEEKQYFTRARATWPDATFAAKSSVLRTPFAGKFNVSGFGRRNSEIEK